LCLHNISNQPQRVMFNSKDIFRSSSGQCVDLITDQQRDDPLNGKLTLQPYQTLWLKNEE